MKNVVDLKKKIKYVENKANIAIEMKKILNKTYCEKVLTRTEIKQEIKSLFKDERTFYCFSNLKKSKTKDYELIVNSYIVKLIEENNLQMTKTLIIIWFSEIVDCLNNIGEIGRIK